MPKNIETLKSRIAFRLPSKDRLKIEQLIAEGEFKNLSHAFRTALREFLSTSERERE